MATQWYAAIDGDQKGPLTLSELKCWAWQGRIDHETFVREGANGEWAPAGTIAELFPDGSRPTPCGQSVAMEPYPETYPMEWYNRRIAAISAGLAVLCWITGLIMLVTFSVLSFSSWYAAMIALISVLAWAVPGGTLGAIVGYLRRAPAVGAMLGGLFGPLGVVAALAIDNRPYCTHCSGRLEDTAETCPHCHADLYDPMTEAEPKSLDETRGELRTWTDSKGQYTMNGRFVGQLNDMVTLRYEDGTVVDVPMERLSEQDQQWIHNASESKEPAGGVLPAILIQE